MSIKANIILKKGKDQAVKRFHHWVFSGAIFKIDGKVEEGDLVKVLDEKNNFLALGLFAGGSIAVRIISFKEIPIDQNFWNQLFESAYQLRINLNLQTEQNNTFRLFNGEGDLISGLIVDIYNFNAVVQLHAKGLENYIDEISKAISRVFQDSLKSIYVKFADHISKEPYYYSKSVDLILPVEVLEHGIKMSVNWETGQKTGFFIDQRENRKILQKYSKDKTILNTFCYTGGFSLYALAAGAKEVQSVDISEDAVRMTNDHVALNGFDKKKHEAFAMDVFNFLKDNQQKFDVIILDPPAFAKSRKSSHNALMGYKRINTEAIKTIKKGGFLFTFSCSQVIDNEMFKGIVLSAAINAGRKVKIVERLSQPGDHPVNIFHPESEYLKGLVLYIEDQ
jgi:23S rRNA (cytosine1962-C5)-methyltransferase